MSFKSKGRPRGRPFSAGADPRRHTLTVEDCRKGWRVTMERHGDRLGLWLFIRLKQTCPGEQAGRGRRKAV